MARDEDTEGQGDDWARHASKWLEHSVELIRDRSVEPIISFVKTVIVGLLVVLVGLVVLACITIGLMRVFDVSVFSGRVWATDLLFGGILLGSGAFLLRKTRAQRSSDARQ